MCEMACEPALGQGNIMKLATTLTGARKKRQVRAWGYASAKGKKKHKKSKLAAGRRRHRRRVRLIFFRSFIRCVAYFSFFLLRRVPLRFLPKCEHLPCLGVRGSIDRSWHACVGVHACLFPLASSSSFLRWSRQILVAKEGKKGTHKGEDNCNCWVPRNRETSTATPRSRAPVDATPPVRSLLFPSRWAVLILFC